MWLTYSRDGQLMKVQLGRFDCISKSTWLKINYFSTQHLLARSKGHRDFHVVGYSFGSMVAVELVRRLEAKGLSGKLTLLDGSPAFMKILQTQHFTSNSKEELQSNILLSMMDMLSPEKSPEVTTLENFSRVWYWNRIISCVVLITMILTATKDEKVGIQRNKNIYWRSTYVLRVFGLL